MGEPSLRGGALAREKGFALRPYLESRRAMVETALSSLWQPRQPASRLTAAMTHSLTAGGKRLRPILCMAAAEAVGGRPEDTLPACCALEMVHTYSLIHDDLPPMDNDALRRGKPTCHVAFDEATAILAGDGLLTLAFQFLASPRNWEKTGDSGPWMRVIAELASAAGPDGMIEGQIRDLAAEKSPPALEDLQKLHELKTGAMIRASLACGAVLGGATDEQYQALQRYAGRIGLAYQVMDDILDVEGDPRRLGKETGADARRNKATYPRIMGMEASREFSRGLVDAALKAISKFDNRSDPLRAIAMYIVERKR